MRGVIWAAVCACALLLGSCIKQEDIKIIGIEDVNLRFPSSVSFMLDVENNSRHKAAVLSCNAQIRYNGYKAGEIILTEPVSVPGRYCGKIPVTLRLRITDPIAGYAAMNCIFEGSDKVTIEGEAVVKAGWARKKIELDGESIAGFINTFVTNN